MVALRDAMNALEEPCLFILDELGSGTDPSEGAALGEAILLDLHERRGFTLCSTHYEPLKARALVTEGMGNAGMEFAEEDRTPTYRLKMGQVGTSRALEIAERSGLPPGLLRTARALLPEGEKHLRDVLSALEEEIVRHETIRAELKAGIEEENAARARMAEALAALEEEKRRFVESLPSKLEDLQERFIADLKSEVNRQSVKRVASKARTRTAKEASTSLGLTAPVEAAHVLPEVGARIRIPGMGITGDVLSVDKGSGRITVDCNGKTLHVGAGDVQVVEGGLPGPARRGGGIDRGPVDASWEINLIGQTVAEAEASLVPFLDRAAMAGLRQVRIIHGIGTGRLKAAVRDLARHSPLVAAWEDAPPSGGGPGATIVSLKD
jgi:DNA mismatch repair protein MutS2